MQNAVRFRWVRSVVLLAMVFSLLLTAVRPAYAELIVNVVNHTSNADYAPGTFGLTALVEDDGFQLLPVGTIQSVRTDQPALCQPLADMGSASFQTTRNINGLNVQTTYFYLVGGRTLNNASSRDTCYTHITNQEGALAAWTSTGAAQQLPIGVYKNQAVAVKSTSGQGYLYSFGGIDPADIRELSVDTIYRSTINSTTGAPSAWTTLEMTMPFTGSNFSQRHDFSMFTFTNDDNETFIYLLGGVSRTAAGAFAVTNPSNEVWRTKVNNDGSLAAWTYINTPIPIRPDAVSCSTPANLGLYDAQVAYFPVINDNGTTTTITPTAYVIGGRVMCADNEALEVISADVYVMSIAQDGSITWKTSWDTSTNPDTPTDVYVLPSPMYGHQTVGYSQKIYVIGGQESNQSAPSRKILGGIALQNQALAPVQSANFYASGDVLPAPLFLHSTEFGRYRSFPIVYIFGGKTGSGSNAYSSNVYYAIPSEDDGGTAGFASSGDYFSPVVDAAAAATPITVTWTAVMTNSTVDAQVSFRVASSRNALFNAPWQIMDAVPAGARYSTFNGGLAQSVAPVPLASQLTGRFIQYRVKLFAPDPDFTPIFKSINIEARIDGYPDLRVVTANIDEGGPVVDLTNSKAPGDTSLLTIVDADIESEGTFFIDMYVFPPESTIVTPTFGLGPDDEIDNGFGQYYAEVNRANLPANGVHRVLPIEWKHANGSPVTSWDNAFNQSGVWTIFIAVDTGGNVTEADAQSPLGEWESDASNIYKFTYSSSFEGGSGLFIPIIQR